MQYGIYRGLKFNVYMHTAVTYDRKWNKNCDN